jgi:hypothetical protein
VKHFNWTGHASRGIGFPAPIKHGIVKLAGNISPTWVGMNADDFPRSVTPTQPDWQRWIFGAGKGKDAETRTSDAARQHKEYIPRLSVETVVVPATFFA